MSHFHFFSLLRHSSVMRRSVACFFRRAQISEPLRRSVTANVRLPHGSPASYCIMSIAAVSAAASGTAMVHTTSDAENRAAAPAAIKPDTVVDFWKDAGEARWYAKDAAFDDDFRRRFESAHMAAARGELDHWMETPNSALALLILLDQFPRNCYRGTAHQFATDPLALAYAYDAVKRGYPAVFAPDLRQFLLMPLMHSEALADQDALLPLCEDMPCGASIRAHPPRYNPEIRSIPTSQCRTRQKIVTRGACVSAGRWIQGLREINPDFV